MTGGPTYWIGSEAPPPPVEPDTVGEWEGGFYHGEHGEEREGRGEPGRWRGSWRQEVIGASGVRSRKSGGVLPSRQGETPMLWGRGRKILPRRARRARRRRRGEESQAGGAWPWRQEVIWGRPESGVGSQGASYQTGREKRRCCGGGAGRFYHGEHGEEGGERRARQVARGHGVRRS